MGLTIEERYNKFYDSMILLKKNFIDLYNFQCEYYNCQEKELESLKIINRWIGKINFIVGTMISHTDSSQCYWLIGPPKNNFKEIRTRTYHLKSEVFGCLELEKSKQGTVSYWIEEASLLHMVKSLTSWDFKSDKENELYAVSLAYVWESIDIIQFTLYSINRYNDNEFDAVKDLYYDLIGDIFTSYKLMFGQIDEIIDTLTDIEIIILNKYKVLENELKKEQLKIGDKEDTEVFDYRALIKKVGLMTEVDVRKYLDDSLKEEYNSKNGIVEKIKPDGIFGQKENEKR